MGLYANPVTFVVNTVSRIFNFRAQLPDAKSIVGEYFEPAASLATQQAIVVKHDVSNASRTRSVIQFSNMKPIADGTLKKQTVNVSYIGHPEHSVADKDDLLELAAVATSAQAFRDGFINRTI